MKNVPCMRYFFHFLDVLQDQCQKYHQNSQKVPGFFCVTCLCIKHSLKDIFLQTKIQKTIFFDKIQKNHFFLFWWNGGQIPYDDRKAYFPQDKTCGFSCKTYVICIFYSI